jgi:two-component system, response regulator YesN
MVKLMIVDDEQIVRDGIKFILEKSFQDSIEIVYSAKSGRDALEAYEEFRPHIVLMDIQMPGINGIEAIRAIKSMNSQVKFVIISAYEQFDYAKSAVELGVNEYILKPINKNRLEKILHHIVTTIEEERAQKIKEIEIQEKMDKIVPVLEYGYIYSILMNDEYQKENSSYYSLLNIQKEYGYMMVIEFGEGNTPKSLENRIGIGIKSDSQYQMIRQMIKYKCKAIVGPLMVNRIVVLVYEDLVDNEYEERIRAIELGESIHKKLEAMLDTQVYIGIGSCYKCHRFNMSYQEALKSIGKMSGEKVLHIKDVVTQPNYEKEYSFSKIKNDQGTIIRKLEEGNTQEVEEKLNQIFTKLIRDYDNDLEIIRMCILELMVLMHTSAFRNGIYSNGRDASEYMNEVKGFTTFYDLKNYCISKAIEITKLIQLEKKQQVSTIISEAMDHININYANDLRLKDIAEVVCISPQYFSKIFKDELGYNFIDYLTHVRIQKAKEMLKEGRLSIKEISYCVGYNDPNYFSRLFKKLEGISPTDFN